MKTALLKKLFLTVSAVFLTANFSYTQDGSTVLNSNQIGNLRLGISSDNIGLAKSSIYFAGKYKLDEVEESLLERLSEESSPKIKVLIALSLYQIGNENGIVKMRKLLESDNDQSVRKFSKEIYDAYFTGIGASLASN